ncbi:LIC_11490 family protein [Leptospira bandrabouensis]|uniref:Uncharacterized protein n=1 Tax=Leptospira bandrabouensis TaxID=2484903 RepID=A0A6H3NY17_9LEPT|nr:hypothetical protein [Leptospira bandrabouensis]MCG6145987.1 hypothetical protein [Leptospira bandrabouensis]MCG6153550.1 hypothetical protein [Leptospira bandrabouensis]MCG6165574.1 hypothetical protein [Leptospira bandrabouensis]MCW7458422.1 hypothetical protein [Leptospira bandrabouensis]MCW7478831.1 hypothetical protein [Leptospira bandrabouensis]
MLFAAFAMILVGVLCFLYVALSPQKAKPTTFPQRKAQSPSPYRMPQSPSVSPQLDERIRKERAISDDRHISYSLPEEVTPSVVQKSEVLLPTEDGNLEEEPPTPKESRFQIEGTLYLDYSGKLTFGEESSDLESMEDGLKNFKRIGSGSLREENGKFLFHSGNVTYTYTPDELDQVVLHNQGIVFLLKDMKAPKPVFFTKDIDTFKDFLKQAALV